VNFFTDTAWSPPIPAAVLVAGFTLGIAAWYVLLLCQPHRVERDEEREVPGAPIAVSTG
jgi:hypothetical protein